MKTGIRLDFGESSRHLLSLRLKTNRSVVFTLKYLSGRALTDLIPFLVRPLGLSGLDFVRLDASTGGIGTETAFLAKLQSWTLTIWGPEECMTLQKQVLILKHSKPTKFKYPA